MRRFLALTAACSVTLAAAAATAAHAKPVMPTDAPVERLLTNVEAYVKVHPDDANGWFTLGRLHYFAFAAPRGTVAVPRGYESAGPNELPSLGGPFSPPGRATTAPETPGRPGLKPAERAAHVKAAITDIGKAIALRDAPRPADQRRTRFPTTPGLYELCLACVYEDGKADAAPDWRERAIALYRKAWEASYPRDSKLGTQPIFGIERLVSREAGQSYLRLVRARGVKPAEKNTVAAIEAGLAKLEALPPGPVTPIVFSLAEPRPLSALIAPRPGGVRFDLDGSGRRGGQVYRAWPAAETAILVWDPSGAGRVVSGRQLFGGATWWMFWRDGYAALDSLDDDRDGWLSGRELTSLALWFDRNGNGVSDPGEVVPVADTAVASLATRADGAEPDDSPRSGAGLRLKDGRTLPTYDWTLR